MEAIRNAKGPWPEDPVHEPTDLFQHELNDRPIVQYLEDLEPTDATDHLFTQLMDFPEITMTVVSVKVGNHHPTHYHEEGPQVAFFLKGKGMMRVGDVEFDVRPGAVVIIPRGVVHFSRNDGDEPLEYLQLISPSRVS